MTYKDHFVVEVKYNGKILRIKDNAVYLPFGSEYTLLLKNLNSKRASVKVHIDGQDVLDYSSLILDGNSSTELKGFLKGSIATNSFKFINKTKEIQEHRGDKIDDGLIRVEFAFEKPKPKTVIHDHHEHHYHHHHHDHYDRWHWWPNFTYTYNNNDSKLGDASNYNSKTTDKTPVGDSFSMTANMSQAVSRGADVDSLGVQSLGAPLDDEGITVKGSEINQAFRYGSIGELESPEVIILNLKGLQDTGKTVEQPITVKEKLTCPTCGIKSKSSYKYCPNCGTYLE